MAHKPLPLASSDLVESARMLAKECNDPEQKTDHCKRTIIEKELRRLQNFHTDSLIQLQRVKVHYEAEIAKTIDNLSESLSMEISKLTVSLQRCLSDLSDQTPSPCFPADYLQRLEAMSEDDELLSVAMEVTQVDLAAVLRQSVSFRMEFREQKQASTKLYKFFGGSNAIGYFDTENETYEKQITSSQKFLHNSCWCTAPSGDLIITGGSLTGHSRNTVTSFSPVTGALQDLEPMSVARRSHASVCSDGFCYVFGGVLDEEKISLCERYDLKEGRWNALPRMKERRAYLGCCEYKGVIVICGGAETSSFEVFNPAEMTFQLYSVPHIDLADVASLVPVGDSILIFHGNFNGEVSRLHPITKENKLCYGNSWSSCAPLLHRGTVYFLRSDSVFKYDLNSGQSSYVLRMAKAVKRREYE